jgi:aspartate/methionine/tyrosine aminotransferase
MSNDAKLQKVILGPDWIDLSFGEPKVVMHALFRQLNRFGDPFKMPTIHDLPKWEYQPAAGKPDLISILEKKYDAKVVICNGAKQALGAAMYAFKRHGCRNIYYDSPYYPANPGIAEAVNLTWADAESAESYLITSPNNPDGRNYSNLDLVNWRYKGPMIHDAAYYTDIYLPDDQITLPLGHIQVFSMSKMYGLSGLRIGYAVVHNEVYYRDMVDYMEMTTAGVSTASQDIARNIELFFRDNPSYYKEFCREARASIALARKELERLDPDVLELVPCQSNSMFGWFKAGPALDNKTAKVHILPGEIFGRPGYMRMNIAHPPEVIREAVDRLNTHKIRS